MLKHTEKFSKVPNKTISKRAREWVEGDASTERQLTLTAKIDASVYKKFHALLIAQDRKITEVVREFVTSYLSKHG